MHWLAGLIIIVTCLVPGAARGEPLTWREGGELKVFRSAPAAELLGAKGFQAYQASLAAGQCDAATSRLNRAFVARYPQFIRASEELEDVFGDYRLWLEVVVLKRFRGLALCRLTARLHTLERVMAARRRPGGPYARPHKDHPSGGGEDSLWYQRDVTVSRLIYLARDGFAPAYQALATLVRRGGLFAGSAAMEYYLLRRACVLSGACANGQDRLEALARSLPPGKRRALDNKAKTLHLLNCLERPCRDL